jgi:hypothetical protein
MKKVKCIHVGDYGNDEFDGPNPKQGDVLTVMREFVYNHVPSYTFVEFGPHYAYSQWRYEEVKQ